MGLHVALKVLCELVIPAELDDGEMAVELLPGPQRWGVQPIWAMLVFRPLKKRGLP